jgi:tetratricopeptide (TPR) repeat protein
MKLVGTHTRRELYITLGVWAVLLLGAISGLLLLRSQAVEIINRIHYVNVSRGSKAAALYAEAEKHARAVMRHYQKLNESSEKKAIVPASDKHLQQSLALYKQAMEIDPQPEFSAERTLAYEMLGQVYEASGNKLGQLLADARALLTVGNKEDALDYIRQAQLANPAAPEPLVLLAQTRLNSNDLAGAKAAIDEVYTSSTITPKARWVKAAVLQNEGRPDLAAAELEKALQAEPHNLDYRLQLAQNQGAAGDKKAAAKTLQAGLADGGWLDPAYLHTYSGYLMELNDLDEAIRVLVQADQLAPYSGDVQFSLAKAYHKAGKTRQAASALRRATEVKPELQDKLLE